MAAVIVFAFAPWGFQWCQAQTAFNQDQTEWVEGPASANLGTVAEIKFPEGYKFADAQGAMEFLHMRVGPNSANGVVGMLSPSSGTGKGVVIFKYGEVGYVKDAGQPPLDSGAILAALSEQIHRETTDALGQAPPISLAWEVEPTYDPDRHTLEWAVSEASMKPGAKPGHSHYVRLLGRFGALDAITVLPQGGDISALPLKDLVKGISFREGYRYADFVEGDKVADLNLAQLVLGFNPSHIVARPTVEAPEPDAAPPGVMFWVILGASICAIAGATVFVVRKLHQHQRESRVPGWAQAQAHGSATPSPAGAVAPAFAGSPINGSGRRRKEIDYTRYFMDLRSAVSDHATLLEPLNGHSNGAVAKAGAQGTGRALPEHVVLSHAEMIAHQKNLIEEQQRLIHEQTKLIEEKSRLVAEQNQLLARQAAMMGERLISG